MKSIAPAESAEAYVDALAGWRKPLVKALRRSALAAAKLDERIKWGHLVYFSNGPVCLIRAEEKRVLLGFWRGQRLQETDSRLKRGGKYEMATITLAEGDTASPTIVGRLVKAAVKLNKQLGDPTDLSGAAKAPRQGTTLASACALGKKLPDVEEVVSYGGRGLKAKGRLFACQAVHKSAEPNSLMVRISLKRRAALLAEHRDTFYVTDHYAPYPAILVRLSRIDRAALRELLTEAWEFSMGGRVASGV